MSSEAKELAGRISDLLRDPPLETESGPAMLLGFALIAEWKSPAGNRWLTESNADAVGDQLPEWTLAGYYHSALDGWPDERDEDDDE